MKSNIIKTINGAALMAAALGLWGCVAEEPFDGEGTGTVYLHTGINNIVTRSDGETTNQDLADNCVIRIYRNNGVPEGDDKTRDGLVYRKTGIKNVESKITLTAGKYIATATAGKSELSSFENKYYEAKNEFLLSKGDVLTINLNCKIQNTIVMIDCDGIDQLPMKDYAITVESSEGGNLKYKKEDGTLYKKGYFMMPEDESGTLTYTISGKKTLDEGDFSLTGTISKVKRSYAYKLKFSYTPTSSEKPGGASNFNIKVDESEADTDNSSITIPSAAPGMEGIGFKVGTTADNAEELNYTEDSKIPSNIAVKTCAVGDFEALTIASDSFGTQTSYDLRQTEVPEGVSLTGKTHDPSTNVTTYYIEISGSFIKGLATGKTHIFSITAKDSNEKESTAVLKIKR